MNGLKFLSIICIFLCLISCTTGFTDGLSFLTKGLSFLNTIGGGGKKAPDKGNTNVKDGVNLRNNNNNNNNNNQNSQPTSVNNIQLDDFGKGKAASKQQWVYSRCPRTGSLFIKTQSGKLLYPGEMNALRNAISPEDLTKEFYIKFSLARPGMKYTIVKYANGLLVNAIFNVNGEDLYNGVSGNKIANKVIGANLDDINRFLTNGENRFCIEVLEQNTDKHFNNLPFKINDWSSPLKKWGDELAGVAGKTCFAVLLPNSKKMSNPGGELGLFLTSYAKQLEEFKKAIEMVKESPGQISVINTTPASSVFFISD